jgi:hypothetical protein
MRFESTVPSEGVGKGRVAESVECQSVAMPRGEQSIVGLSHPRKGPIDRELAVSLLDQVVKETAVYRQDMQWSGCTRVVVLASSNHHLVCAMRSVLQCSLASCRSEISFDI